jgi:hypothetical protein
VICAAFMLIPLFNASSGVGSSFQTVDYAIMCPHRAVHIELSSSRGRSPNETIRGVRSPRAKILQYIHPKWSNPIRSSLQRSSLICAT